MKTLIPALALSLLAAGCATPVLNTTDALAANKIEMSLTADGRPGETEFHISPDDVPDAVRSAMDALHPGDAFTGAEREVNNGILYFELSRVVDGMEVEAMFLPDGTLHNQEIQVAEDKVPEAVQAAAKSAVDGATVKHWEEIHDSTSLFEYHVKLSAGEKHYKVVITTAGKLVQVWREIPAEIEVLVK